MDIGLGVSKGLPRLFIPDIPITVFTFALAPLRPLRGKNFRRAALVSLSGKVFPTVLHAGTLPPLSLSVLEVPVKRPKRKISRNRNGYMVKRSFRFELIWKYKKKKHRNWTTLNIWIGKFPQIPDYLAKMKIIFYIPFYYAAQISIYAGSINIKASSFLVGF